jgi:hypothetical protein
MATKASTLTGAGPAARPRLIGLWLAVVAVVLATILAVALMVGRATPTGTEPATGTRVSRTDTTGPKAPAHQPFKVNGNICGQCR